MAFFLRLFVVGENFQCRQSGTIESNEMNSCSSLVHLLPDWTTLTQGGEYGRHCKLFSKRF